jgi:UTP--glucose-1-phosphate uridylyltransferase
MDRGEGHFPEFAARMRAANVSEAAIRAFSYSYQNLLAGQTGLFPETGIEPVTELPNLSDVAGAGPAGTTLVDQTVVVKLNGGLGTSMGLEGTKSLLQVKNGLTFLDFIASQVLHLRQRGGGYPRFLLMNSFSTSVDTLQFLRKYPELGDPSTLELMQSQVPKVDARTLRPVSWPQNPQLEWCPPGHGDLYPSLLGSGLLERFLAEGVRYAFVSNADNLGATLDLNLLNYFACSGKPFVMEVALRTPSDGKGGHLARCASRFMLRESAQCPEADRTAFQDIKRHRFFNTNNLWIRLDALRELLDAHDGLVPLPLIRNSKTVDPRDKNSPPVFQLETAMGAAIECFEDSGAILVPRARFAPVKTTSDLLVLRSDAYRVTEDWRVILADPERSMPPLVSLDEKHYKLVDQLNEKTAAGVPSLKRCLELTVQGPVLFDPRIVFTGNVSIKSEGDEPWPLPPGEYQDCVISQDRVVRQGT